MKTKLTDDKCKVSLGNYKIMDDGIWIPKSEVERIYTKFNVDRAPATKGMSSYDKGMEEGRLSFWKLLLKLFP